MIKIERARPDDVADFSRMILLSAPYFPELLGPGIQNVLERMFVKKKNLFSFTHVHKAVVSGVTAGMLLSYSDAERKYEQWITGWQLFRQIPFRMAKNIQILLQLDKTTGSPGAGNYYISNIATFPEFRRQGVAVELMHCARELAEKSTSLGIVLDVEAENTAARSLYEKLGFKTEKKFRIAGSGLALSFVRMKL